MKRLPIKAAKDLATAYDQSQVILVTWDDNDQLTHVVSYGRSQKQCEHAADGANLVKRALGFPESMCHDKPARWFHQSADPQVPFQVGELVGVPDGDEAVLIRIEKVQPDRRVIATVVKLGSTFSAERLPGTPTTSQGFTLGEALVLRNSATGLWVIEHPAKRPWFSLLVREDGTKTFEHYR